MMRQGIIRSELPTMAGAPQDTPSPDLTPEARSYDLGRTGQRVFQCLSFGLVVFGRRLEIIHYNPAAEFLVRGFASVEEALQNGTVDARYQDWRQALRGVIDRGREQRFDQVIYHDAEQGERLLNLLCIPLTDELTGEIIGGTLVIEDVTVVASMEKRLAVSERMAAVGKLAARVAHELNNPLDGILRFLNLALRAEELGKREKIPEYLTQARGGLMRMTDIVRELVEFSRSTATAFDDAGINTVVEEAVKVMSDKAVAGGVSVVCTLSDNMPAIRGTSLFQVCCNLVKNAVDAMPDGGTLTIATKVVDREAIIRFEDSGIGLPEEIEKIFEPFFTTKAPGKGTGLGLAICKDIIEKYNGKIIPERRVQGGTAFTIRLPLESCTPMRPADGSGVPDAARSRFAQPRKETSA
jgi:signal transduction histidine kinase